jgi:hypothetical protein
LWDGTPDARLALSGMRTRIVAVIQVTLPDGQEAVALLFDNMRWTLDFADYEAIKEEIGSVVDVTDYEEIPALLN